MFHKTLLDRRANLYMLFIEKCLRHLEPGGELIFITPRDFLKATSAVPLNQKLFSLGAITKFIDLGDSHIFGEVSPNCAIWRSEKDNYLRETQYATLCQGGRLERANTLNWEKRSFRPSFVCAEPLSFAFGGYSLCESRWRVRRGRSVY